jgi:hypothetical protein
MFVGKAVAYPRVEHLKGDLLHTNIRLGWKAPGFVKLTEERQTKLECFSFERFPILV